MTVDDDLDNSVVVLSALPSPRTPPNRQLSRSPSPPPDREPPANFDTVVLNLLPGVDTTRTDTLVRAEQKRLGSTSDAVWLGESDSLATMQSHLAHAVYIFVNGADSKHMTKQLALCVMDKIDVADTRVFVVSSRAFNAALGPFAKGRLDDVRVFGPTDLYQLQLPKLPPPIDEEEQRPAATAGLVADLKQPGKPVYHGSEKAGDHFAFLFETECLVPFANEKFGVTSHIELLRKNLMLPEEVINFCGRIFQSNAHAQRIRPTSFVCNTSLASALLEKKSHAAACQWVDFTRFDQILIPVVLRLHYVLVVVSMRDKQLRYYDSNSAAKHADANRREIISVVRKFLADDAACRPPSYFVDSEWTTNERTVPQQTDDTSCGVFLLGFMESVVSNRLVEFTQNHIPDLRARYYNMIYQHRTHKRRPQLKCLSGFVECVPVENYVAKQ